MIFLLSRLIAVRLVLGCVKAIDRLFLIRGKKFGRVAQLVEHSTLNRLVVGSIPTASTISNLFIINAIEGHKYCFSFNLRSLPPPINLRHDCNLSACLRIVLSPSPRSRPTQSLSDTPRLFAEGEPTSQRLSGDGRRQEEAGHAGPEVGHRLKLDASAVSRAKGMICLTSPEGLCRATESFPRGVTGREQEERRRSC